MKLPLQPEEPNCEHIKTANSESWIDAITDPGWGEGEEIHFCRHSLEQSSREQLASIYIHEMNIHWQIGRVSRPSADVLKSKIEKKLYSASLKQLVVIDSIVRTIKPLLEAGKQEKWISLTEPHVVHLAGILQVYLEYSGTPQGDSFLIGHNYDFIKKLNVGFRQISG